MQWPLRWPAFLSLPRYLRSCERHLYDGYGTSGPGHFVVGIKQRPAVYNKPADVERVDRVGRAVVERVAVFVGRIGFVQCAGFKRGAVIKSADLEHPAVLEPFIRFFDRRSQLIERSTVIRRAVTERFGIVKCRTVVE